MPQKMRRALPKGQSPASSPQGGSARFLWLSFVRIPSRPSRARYFWLLSTHRPARPSGDPQPREKEASRSHEGRRGADWGLQGGDAGPGGRCSPALLLESRSRVGQPGAPRRPGLLTAELLPQRAAPRRPAPRRSNCPPPPPPLFPARPLPVPPSSPPLPLAIERRSQPIRPRALGRPSLIGSFGRLFKNKPWSPRSLRRRAMRSRCLETGSRGLWAAGQGELEPGFDRPGAAAGRVEEEGEACAAGWSLTLPVEPGPWLSSRRRASL